MCTAEGMPHRRLKEACLARRGLDPVLGRLAARAGTWCTQPTLAPGSQPQVLCATPRGTCTALSACPGAIWCDPAGAGAHPDARARLHSGPGALPALRPRGGPLPGVVRAGRPGPAWCMPSRQPTQVPAALSLRLRNELYLLLHGRTQSGCHRGLVACMAGGLHTCRLPHGPSPPQDQGARPPSHAA